MASDDEESSDAKSSGGESCDKIHAFDMQLSRLESAKDQLVAQMKSERLALITNYEQMVDKLKRDMTSMEKSLREQLSEVTAEKIAIDERASQERNGLSLKLKHAESELFALKLASDEANTRFDELLKQKNKAIEDIENRKNEKENEFTHTINKLEKQIHDLNGEISHLKMKCDSTLRESNDLRLSLNASESENEKLKANILSANEKYNDLNMKCESLVSDNEKLKQVLESETKAKLDKIQTIQSLTDALNENHSEIERLKKNWDEIEKSLNKEIGSLKDESTLVENTLRQQISELNSDKINSDKKFANEINSLLLKLNEREEELHQSKVSAEKATNDFESQISDKDKHIHNLESDKSQLESDLTKEISNLSKEIEVTKNNLLDVTIKRDKALTQVTQLKGQIVNINNENEVLKSSLLNVNEKCFELEMKNDSLNNDIEKFKLLLEMEVKEKREKLQAIETLNNTNRENQLEIKRLTKSLGDMEKSCRDCEEARASVMRDCNELRATLMEVEKSRLEIRRDLNNAKINCASLENKLKLKENDSQDLVRRVETLKEERNSLKDSLESFRKSLTQMKDINMQLSTRNKQLQAQISLSETERRETERQLNLTTKSITDRDNELSFMKRETESLSEKYGKLDAENKRLERSYSLIEKEKSNLKVALNDIQRKSNKSFQNNSRSDPFIDEAKIITQGLAALEQKNIELQRRVQGLQSLMNESENSNQTNNSQINGNTSVNESDKLRSAQKEAQLLIDRTPNKQLSDLEKELARYSINPTLTSTPLRFKNSPIRSSSTSKLSHQNHYENETSNQLSAYSSSSELHIKKKSGHNKN